MSESLVAAVVIDDWKESIFDKILCDAGYTYTTQDGITSDTLILKVITKDVVKLAKYVRQANDKARLSKLH